MLVTGADGFIGFHLVEEFVRSGADVHIFVRATSSGALHNTAHLRERIRIHRGELTDKQAVRTALRALEGGGGRPVIFHFGAQAHVGESWSRPYETIETNPVGTLNLDLELDGQRIDIAGSSEEYSNILEEMREQYCFDAKGRAHS